MPAFSIQPWARADAPTEETIQELFRLEGLSPYRWSNGPGDSYPSHDHPYHKVIYVVRGSITFGAPESGQEVTLKAGDRLDLPPGVSHNAVVGPQGVVCLEAQRSF